MSTFLIYFCTVPFIVITVTIIACKIEDKRQSKSIKDLSSNIDWSQYVPPDIRISTKRPIKNFKFGR